MVKIEFNLVHVVVECPIIEYTIRVNSFLKEHCYFYVPAVILSSYVYFHKLFVLKTQVYCKLFIIQPKLRSEMNRTKVSHKISLMKSSGNHFIFLPVFYLITWVMKALKNFGKIGILKLWELIYLGEVKTHFGKLALKWCIFRHEKKYLNWYYVIALDPIRI